MGQNAGYTTTVEYVKETAFGTLPTDPEMEWIGIVTDAKLRINRNRFPRGILLMLPTLIRSLLPISILRL